MHQKKKDMNDETTRLINEEPAINQAAAAAAAEHPSKSRSKKNSKNNNPVAAAAGGFVAGATAGVGATAYASTSENEETIAAEVAPAEEEPKEEMVTPEPEQVILANDEGIRYAHVEADSFGEAYAQARQQVGPGGVFEYDGKIFSTYNWEEWHSMTAQERTEYQAKVFENVPAPAPRHATAPRATAVEVEAEPVVDTEPEQAIETQEQDEPQPVEANAEMIADEQSDNEIRVLGVEAVETPDGQPMNIALIESQGEQALLIDINNNGKIDVMVYDQNHDGQIQEDEVHDMSEAGIEVDELARMQATQEGNMLYASNDDMPDYVNDADTLMTV